jgi:hypothetical protein
VTFQDAEYSLVVGFLTAQGYMISKCYPEVDGRSLKPTGKSKIVAERLLEETK